VSNTGPLTSFTDSSSSTHAEQGCPRLCHLTPTSLHGPMLPMPTNPSRRQPTTQILSRILRLTTDRNAPWPRCLPGGKSPTDLHFHIQAQRAVVPQKKVTLMRQPYISERSRPSRRRRAWDGTVTQASPPRAGQSCVHSAATSECPVSPPIQPAQAQRRWISPPPPPPSGGRGAGEIERTGGTRYTPHVRSCRAGARGMQAAGSEGTHHAVWRRS